MKIKNFSQAKKFLYQQIPASLNQIFSAGSGLKRTKYFLKLLGQPQNNLRVIHVAGTSGKGSTAYLVSLILKNLGFKVGLTISPHLLDLRERVQINNQLLGKQKFVSYLNELIPCINKMKLTSSGSPTYFEILTSLAFYTFWKEKVDYAVVETGLGGLYDATNSVTNRDKLAVITRIGRDHTWILGKSLKRIAFQKAGIIQKGNTVISLWQRPSARRVIEKIAHQKRAQLLLVRKNGGTLSFSKVRVTPGKTVFNFYSSDSKIEDLELSLIGLHQAENCSLALATVLFLSQRGDFLFDLKKIREALKKASFSGRFEQHQINGKTLILDGAHNPQKMAALTKTLNAIWPEEKFNFLIAVKKGKDYKKILKYIVPLANQIIVTSFTVSAQDLIHQSEKPKDLEEALKKLAFKNYKTVANSQKALEAALLNHDSLVIDSLVITGSLYLIAELYPLLKLPDCK